VISVVEQRPTPTREELLWAARNIRVPRLRSMREFAEQEIILPKGPCEGLHFRCDRQPWTKLWFDAIDSGLWPERVLTGPSQSGKSLCGYVIPALYHLFEVQETVILGIPDLDMANDKWTEDIQPVIERSAYRELLPKSGLGSKGGKFKTIRFLNGRSLRFMSGKGDDKSRASYTSRVLIITETDGMDESSGTSREANKIKQMEARTRAYGDRRCIYKECTLSTEEGHTYSKISEGTDSRIVLPCPHCRNWVTPEREHLQGWQSAETEVQAGQESYFYCPKCGAQWSEGDRMQANAGARLLHKGQTITKSGKVKGKLPPTYTLGLRYSAVNNLFVSAGNIGRDEWRAAREANEDDAEKELLQFIWAKPYRPPTMDLSALDAKLIIKRLGGEGRGVVPANSKWLSVGVDLGKYLAHWVAIAWRSGASGQVIDYGRFEVPSSELGEEVALLTALRQFRDEVCEQGWQGENGIIIPHLVGVDSGWQGPHSDSDPVYQFCNENPGRYRPIKGFGTGQYAGSHYRSPKKHSKEVKWIGDNYHLSRVSKNGQVVLLMEINADHWKTYLHTRLSTPIDQPGALVLFNTAKPVEHMSFARHLTAERKVEEYQPGKGVVVKWVREKQANHWLDCSYIACAMGHLCGVRVTGMQESPPAKQKRTLPSGRPERAIRRNY